MCGEVIIHGLRSHNVHGRDLQPPIVAILVFAFGAGCAQPAATQVTYGYYYEGELISLTPSMQLVAINETGSEFRGFASDRDLERDPLSSQLATSGRSLAIYRVTSQSDVDLASAITNFAEATGEEIQPVFEQGGSLLIPSDELIVRFEDPTSEQEAQEFFADWASSQGILSVTERRRNSYMLRIDRPSNGRVYQVSQFIAGLKGVDSAEPNHLVVQVEKPVRPGVPADLSRGATGEG